MPGRVSPQDSNFEVTQPLEHTRTQGTTGQRKVSFYCSYALLRMGGVRCDEVFYKMAMQLIIKDDLDPLINY